MLSGWLNLGSETSMDGSIANKSNYLLIAGGLILASCVSGCSLLGVPSQRYADSGCSQTCAGGPLPPLPGRLAEWQAQKELPVAPEYPRFHPLPTRPMFSPKNLDYPHQ